MNAVHIVVAMKPVEGNYAENAVEHGVVGLNLDGSRVGYSGVADKSESCDKQTRKPIGGFSDREGTLYGTSRGIGYKSPVGRFPANVILDGSDEVTDKFSMVKGMSGGGTRKKKSKIMPSIQVIGESVHDHLCRADSGSAARFFKECKV